MTTERYKDGSIGKPPDFVETTLLAETLLPLLGVELPTRLDNPGDARKHRGAGNKEWIAPPVGQLIQAKCVHLDGVKERLSSLFSQNEHGLTSTEWKSSAQVNRSDSLTRTYQQVRAIKYLDQIRVTPSPPPRALEAMDHEKNTERTLSSPLVTRRKLTPQHYRPVEHPSPELDKVNHIPTVQVARTEMKSVPSSRENCPVLLLPSNLQRVTETFTPRFL